MLNLSIDPPDLHSHTIPEDLSINDIESVIELVIEDILGFDSFFAENDEADDNDYIVHNDFCFISNYDYTKSIKA
ncbi:MAG: hypothetical protein MUE95_13445, partial [Cyclobacteriaceae bacterium]|nr:hypothetical protein [Cyclobacteriaceae bacterium]